jgi:hypothetical protein
MPDQQNVLLRLPTPSHSRYTNLLSDIEKGEIKIPQFQRDFVWSIQKSAALLDSIIKGYPIGTFIFWATKDRLRSVRDLGNIKLPDPKEGEVVSFVLDGQQRITSLFATLKGLKVQRASGKEDDFSDSYVDLQAKPDEQIVIPRSRVRLYRMHGHIRRTNLGHCVSDKAISDWRLGYRSHSAERRTAKPIISKCQLGASH